MEHQISVDRSARVKGVPALKIRAFSFEGFNGLSANNTQCRERLVSVARRNHGILNALVKFPWWVCVGLAGVVYVLSAFVLPELTLASPVLKNLPSGLARAGPILSMVLLGVAVVSAFFQFRKGKLLERQTGLDSVGDLSWRQFESLVSEAFRRKGFLVLDNIEDGPDGGIDLRLRKNGQVVFVQCKHWKARSVGVKTLVGLNVATRRRELNQPTHAVFLSGNGPLVAVLREALTRDEVARRKSQGDNVRKGKVAESVKAFIQNVHNFRDEALIHPDPPIDHVVIFDEAQRAWNLRQTENFMRRKKNRPGFSNSEPEFLISYMDRHADWAVIVCLVGGGQEINTGEAGIDAWLDAVNSQFPYWHMHISSRLNDSEYAAGKALEVVRQRQNTHFDDCLHLAVSMRSFRAENVSEFVKALLDCEQDHAREALTRLRDRYPIAVTRNLNLGKQWIHTRARGSERFGLVASSKAQRLKPHAIDIRVDVNPVHWFLNSKEDTRSSFYLEDAATEFQVQGLELDWACVTWDGDLRFTGCGWSFHDFRGTRWCNIANPDNRRYLQNAYRVLLTRARQGMVIFVPQGDSSDPTRSPEFYDSTFHYLTELGIPLLS